MSNYLSNSSKYRSSLSNWWLLNWPCWHPRSLQSYLRGPHWPWKKDKMVRGHQRLQGSTPPSPERTPLSSATSKTQNQTKPNPCLRKQSSTPTALINKYSNLWIYIWPLLKGLENNPLRCLNMPPAVLFTLSY